MRGSSLKYLRTAGALAAAAALAVPVAASAHPTAYTDPTGALKEGATPPFDPATDYDARHVVVNHGYPHVLIETNGEATARGVLSYATIPDDATAAEAIAVGDTGAQPHHTCRTPALDDQANILAWQDDPFYNYVPFQKAAAGLDDDPSDWIGLVEAETAVDLTQVSDDPATAAGQLKTLCEGIAGGGTFVEADELERGPERFASGVIEPLEEEIANLKEDLSGAEQALAAALSAAEAARARLGTVMPELRPMGVTLPTARLAARRLAGDGMTVTLTGSPLRPVTLQLLTSRGSANRLGLRSRVLARATTTFGADGTAEATLKPKRAVARAVRRLRGSIGMKVRIVSGDRVASARGTIGR
jgi:hypothetical protein